jgi:hypothetical protein
MLNERGKIQLQRAQLKGQYFGLFWQTIPLGPLIHALKLIRIWICVREDIRLQKSTPRYDAQRGVDFYSQQILLLYFTEIM